MADVILDQTTRAPSASWQTVLRLVAAAAVAKIALWLSGYGVDLSATDQVALVSVFVALSAAIGTEARDRGWPVLRVLLVLPLVIALASCAYAHGPQGTAFAIGDAVAKSTARACSADGGTISNNARLMVAQAVAAGVKAAIGGGIPSIDGLLPAMTPAGIENPVEVVPAPVP